MPGDFRLIVSSRSDEGHNTIARGILYRSDRVMPFFVPEN